MRMAKQRFHNMERSVDQAVAEVKADKDAQYARARAADYEKRALQGSVSRDEILTAGEVDVYGYGWLRVIKVNKTTVKVANPYAWDGESSYPLRRVIGVRQAPHRACQEEEVENKHV